MSTLKFQCISWLAQGVEDVATKREREARRRRMLVEQQATAAEAERRVEAEALLNTLARQSTQVGWAGLACTCALRLWVSAE